MISCWIGNASFDSNAQLSRVKHSMAPRSKVILCIMSVMSLTASAVAAEFTYKDYAKEPETWKRGYVFGISRYMSVVAQPDEEPPYQLREAFQRCLTNTTDIILVH